MRPSAQLREQRRLSESVMKHGIPSHCILSSLVPQQRVPHCGTQRRVKTPQVISATRKYATLAERSQCASPSGRQLAEHLARLAQLAHCLQRHLGQGRVKDQLQHLLREIEKMDGAAFARNPAGISPKPHPADLPATTLGGHEHSSAQFPTGRRVGEGASASGLNGPGGRIDSTLLQSGAALFWLFWFSEVTMSSSYVARAKTDF